MKIQSVIVLLCLLTQITVGSYPVHAAASLPSFATLTNNVDKLKLFGFEVTRSDKRNPSFLLSNNEKIKIAIAQLKAPVTYDQILSQKTTVANYGSSIVSSELSQALGVFGNAISSTDVNQVKTALLLGKYLSAYGTLKYAINKFKTDRSALISSNSKVASRVSEIETQLSSFKNELKTVTNISTWTSTQQKSLYNTASTGESAVKSLVIDVSTDGTGGSGPAELGAALLMVWIAVLVEVVAIVIPVVVIGIVPWDYTNLEKLASAQSMQAAQIIQER